jgi:hypothetical protein
MMREGLVSTTESYAQSAHYATLASLKNTPVVNKMG